MGALRCGNARVATRLRRNEPIHRAPGPLGARGTHRWPRLIYSLALGAEAFHAFSADYFFLLLGVVNALGLLLLAVAWALGAGRSRSSRHPLRHPAIRVTPHASHKPIQHQEAWD
jgi:hypothetical protein